MNLLLRSRPLLLSGVLALGSVLPSAAPAAHAATIRRPPPPTGHVQVGQLTVIGGNDEVTILSDRGWAPGTSIHFAVQSPGSANPIDQRDVWVDPCGGFSDWANQQCTSEYVHFNNMYDDVGDVIVTADVPGANPVTRGAHVSPMPTLTATVFPGPNCSGSIEVTGSGFATGSQGATVHLQLMDTSWNLITGGNPGRPLIADTSVDQSGNMAAVTFGTTDVSATQNLRVIADEQVPYGQTQGSNIVSLC